MAFPTSYSDSALVKTDVVHDANPGADSLKYRGLLKEIDNGLGIRDMEKLKYLCQDLGVAPRKFENMTRGIYLFTELEKLALITADDISLLVDLMKAINRYDLVKKLKAWSSKEGTLAHRLSAYRSLMLRISDSLSRDEREQFTFYLGGGDCPLPVASIEEAKTLLQLFVLMEKYTLIGPGDLDYFNKIMQSIGNFAIVKEIEKYLASESSSVQYLPQSTSPSFQPHQGGGVAYNTGNVSNTRSNSAPTLKGYNQNPTWYGHHEVPQTQQPYHNYPPQQYQQPHHQVPQQAPTSFSQQYQQHEQQQVTKREPEDRTSSATSSLTIGPERPKWYYEAIQKYGSARADELWEQVVQKIRADEIRKRMQEMTISEQRRAEMSTPSIKTEPVDEDEVEASVTRNLRLEPIEDITSSTGSQQSNTPTDEGHRIVPAQTATVRHRPSADAFYMPELPKYDMNRTPRGLCIIFNAENFTKEKGKLHLDRRDGTQKDVEGLLNTFQGNLRFKTRVEQDPTRQKYLDCLKELTEMDHSDFDCFVCIILSHGSEGCVYGTDGESVLIDALTGRFRGEYVPSLVNKPKLFFIQACQGKNAQKSVDIQQDATATLPNEADTLISLSTVPGYASNRSISQGTWFISSLCRIINTYYKNVDLLTMLTMVNELLSQAADRQKKKQIGMPSHTLRKQIFFNQGLGD